MCCRRRSRSTRKHEPRANFDSFLDLLERRVFRIAMLIVLLLWLSEKVCDTAIATHLPVFAASTSKTNTTCSMPATSEVHRPDSRATQTASKGDRMTSAKFMRYDGQRKRQGRSAKIKPVKSTSQDYWNA